MVQNGTDKLKVQQVGMEAKESHLIIIKDWISDINLMSRYSIEQNGFLEKKLVHGKMQLNKGITEMGYNLWKLHKLIQCLFLNKWITCMRRGFQYMCDEIYAVIG